MPQREPRADGETDVPDGFEFLNEARSAETSQLASTSGFSRRSWALVAAVVAFLVLLVGIVLLARWQSSPSTQPSPSGTSSPSSPEPTSSTSPGPSKPPAPTATTAPTNGAAAQMLEALEVKGRAPTTGYERERFGPDWADVDRNGCDTRNDVLRRDLTAISADPDNPCEVESGVLLDPYSGDRIEFTRGWETSYAVQIDHVVALSNAWQTGAQYWKPRKRMGFANDPLNLLAVDGELNLQKSDGDAATWLPPNKPYRCAYVARQIAVKVKYGLWLTAPERNAMARILSTCPDQDLPSTSRR